MLMLSLATAFAFTPDGLTPAVEDVCDDYSGAAYGTCVAYCEATDCDEDPHASDRACDMLYDRFESLTGEAPPCEVREYIVDVVYSGDDSTVVHVDGLEQPFLFGDQYWSQENTRTFVMESGDHVVGFNVYDRARVAVGLGYLIYVDGQLVARSDDTNATIHASYPGASWATAGFDDSAWQNTVVCRRSWGHPNLATLMSESVRWVWTNSACSPYDLNPRETWTRVELSLP